MCHYQNSFCNNPPQQCTKCSTVHQQSPKKRLCKQSKNLKTLIRRVIIFQFAFSSSRCCFRAFTLEDETLGSKYLQLALAFSESITFFSHRQLPRLGKSTRGMKCVERAHISCFELICISRIGCCYDDCARCANGI